MGDRFDYLRRAMMLEPRGDPDIHGAILAPPSDPAYDAAVLFRRPEGPDLSFVYGVILTSGERLTRGEVTHNRCWFGEAQIDRSLPGSGVSARLAIAHVRGEALPGAPCPSPGRRERFLTTAPPDQPIEGSSRPSRAAPIIRRVQS